MLERLLPIHIYNELLNAVSIDVVTEIRMRLGKRLKYAVGGAYRTLDTVTVSEDDIDFAIAAACNYSMYAYDECIAAGFLPCQGGIRVGISGEGVMFGDRLSGIKNITSLCIRLPHEVKGCCDKISCITRDFDSTLIISRPGLGKTTMLRELIRLLAQEGYNVLVSDDRYELSGAYDKKAYLDLGECSDVAVGIPKNVVYSSMVRSMRPDVLATDEVFGLQEIEAVRDVIRCGVKVAATVHADSLEALLRSEQYRRLCEQMRYFVVLGGIGIVEKLYDKKEASECGR